MSAAGPLVLALERLTAELLDARKKLLARREKELPDVKGRGAFKSGEGNGERERSPSDGGDRRSRFFSTTGSSTWGTSALGEGASPPLLDLRKLKKRDWRNDMVAGKRGCCFGCQG